MLVHGIGYEIVSRNLMRGGRMQRMQRTNVFSHAEWQRNAATS